MLYLDRLVSTVRNLGRSGLRQIARATALLAVLVASAIGGVSGAKATFMLSNFVFADDTTLNGSFSINA